jgi:hypothetical protein
VLAPILTAVTALWIDIPVVGRIGIGAHYWYEVVGVLVMSLSILALNPRYLCHRWVDFRSGRNPAHSDKEP